LVIRHGRPGHGEDVVDREQVWQVADQPEILLIKFPTSRKVVVTAVRL
jgi:hypothetical protein